ncbi:MAG TPA: class I SAM-dependent methyltransferase [Candidatus Eremiobacteraceae bacterium]
MDLTEHAAKNRRHWDATADDYQTKHAAQLDWRKPPCWGVWERPESELQILGDVGGLDVLEFGCGAAQWSIALHLLGARMVALDNSARQLQHARRLMDEAGVEFPLVHASAEAVPLADDSFDLIFCDHGAMSFCDPYRSVAEAARMLRAGGRFIFNMATPLVELTYSDLESKSTETFQRDYFGLHRVEDADTVSFNLPYGEWIRVFSEHGLDVEALIELRPPEGAPSTYGDYVRLEWARRWPAENIWKTRKRLPAQGAPRSG